MNLEKINKKKIFVTGYSGAGKSTFAKEYSVKFGVRYIDFDSKWDYKEITLAGYEKMVGNYTGEFITDAIPYTSINNKFLFEDYYNQHKDDIKIVCVYDDNLDELVAKRPKKTWKDVYEESFDFYHDTMNFIRSWTDVEIIYYNSHTNQYSTYDEFREKMRNMYRGGFRNYLNLLEYDKNYGAIECINFPGYTNSVRTWNNIKGLVDWNGKKVADLGCFHGYFGFKATQAGAKVTGLDRSPPVLKTTKIINFIEDNPLELKQWEGGEEVPEEYEITLALNVIHNHIDIVLRGQHFPDQFYYVKKNKI